MIKTLRPLSIALLGLSSLFADWPSWGRDAHRNMYSPEKNIPDQFMPGEYDPKTKDLDPKTIKGVLWNAKLGSQTYGNISIAEGKILVGTNNMFPRDPKHVGDRGILACFDQKTGKFLWQLVVPKLGAGKVSDWEYLGICSSAAIDKGRAYIITNQCDVLCLDLNGLANGNDGPFKDEAKYFAQGNKPVTLGKQDADIIWRFDMREELGVFPHNITSSSVMIFEDKIWAVTSNGQDWSHINIPSPQAPCLIALDKNTGELYAEESSKISTRLIHCNWSSPAGAKVGQQNMVFFGAGDGFLYGFDTKPTKDAEGFDVLKELFRNDANPKEYRFKDGKPIKYPSFDGHSEIISTPIFYDGLVYTAIGQDPEHGEGVGMMTCVNPAKIKDGKAEVVWTYKKLNRTISTPAAANGLVFMADYSGYLHCVDAKTGKAYWTHNTDSHIWSSPMVADGKVYLGNEDGMLFILKAEKEKKLVAEIEFDSALHSSPVAANGMLYIATMTRLYAIGPK